MKKRVTVGKNIDTLTGTFNVKTFHSVSQAEEYVAKVLFVTDKDGVERGDYYIDAPEELINPRK